MADLNSTIVRGKLRVTEDINANGNIAGSSIAGNGSGLTNLNASNISSGTLSADRLATSGATAGSYGPSANATPAYGGTFNVPYITVDNKGRVTAASTKTVKIPASDNLDTHYTNYLQIKGNGTEAVKFTQDADKTLNLKPGTNVSISAASGEITISAANTHNSHIVYSGKKADGTTDISSGTASYGNITLGDSGVTAGAYGDTAAQTPGYNATFKVPSISVNAKGIVTAIGEHTVKIPDNSNLVPYTGASKDVDLGDHSLLIANSIYGYDGITHNGQKLLLPEKGGVIALTTDLSTLLDKGTSSTATANQVVYNQVEMKKALIVPSLSGEKTTIAGNEVPSFSLSRFTSPSDYIPKLVLNSFPIGATDLNAVYTTTIEQVADSFTISCESNTMNSPSFGFDTEFGWNIEDARILTENDLPTTQQWKLTSTTGTVTTVNICVK